LAVLGVGISAASLAKPIFCSRNVYTGGLEVYDVNNNQLTGAAFLGTIGLDWQFAGMITSGVNLTRLPLGGELTYAVVMAALERSSELPSTHRFNQRTRIPFFGRGII
jgi:hypothetical protein